jgi:hypothetical protein
MFTSGGLELSAESVPLLDAFQPRQRTLRPRIPRAPQPPHIPRSERIPKGANTTPTTTALEVLRTNLFLGIFLTSDLHPQLVTMIFHYQFIGAVNIKFWVENAPGFLLEASRVSTPLEVASTVIKNTVDRIVTEGFDAITENPLLLLKRMRNDWYKNRFIKWDRICSSVKSGHVEELINLPIEQQGPWPLSHEALLDSDDFNVHTIEYKSYAPLKCPCFGCLEGRYKHTQAERVRANGRAKANALNVAMDEIGKSRRCHRAFVDIAYSVSNPEEAIELHLEKQNLVIETESLRSASALLRLFHAEEALLLAGDAAFVSEKAKNMRKALDVFGAPLNPNLQSDFVDDVLTKSRFSPPIPQTSATASPSEACNIQQMSRSESTSGPSPRLHSGATSASTQSTSHLTEISSYSLSESEVNQNAQKYIADPLLPFLDRLARFLPYHWTASPSTLNRKLSFDQFNIRSVSSDIVSWMGMPSPVSAVFGPSIEESTNLLKKVALHEGLVGPTYHCRDELSAHFLGPAGVEKGFGTGIELTPKAGVTTTPAPTADASNEDKLSHSYKVVRDYRDNKDWFALNVNVLSIPWVLPLEIGAAIVVAAAHITGREAKIATRTRYKAFAAVLEPEVQERLTAAIKRSRGSLVSPLRPLNYETSFNTYLETSPLSGIPGVRVSSSLVKNLREQVFKTMRNAENGIISRILFAAYVPSHPFIMKKGVGRTPEGKSVLTGNCFGFDPLPSSGQVRSMLVNTSLEGVEGHIAVRAIAIAHLHDPSGEPARTVPIYALRQAHQTLALFQTLGLLPRDHIGLLLDADDAVSLDPAGQDPLPEEPKDPKQAKLWTENCVRSYLDAAVQQYGAEACAPFVAGTITSNSGEVISFPVHCGSHSPPKTRWGYFNGQYSSLSPGTDAAIKARQFSQGPLSTALSRVYHLNQTITKAFAQMNHSLPIPVTTTLTLLKRLPDSYDSVARDELTLPQHAKTSSYQKILLNGTYFNSVYAIPPIISLGRSRETADFINYTIGFQQASVELNKKGLDISASVGLPWTTKPISLVFGGVPTTRGVRLTELKELSQKCIRHAIEIASKGGAASSSAIASSFKAEIERAEALAPGGPQVSLIRPQAYFNFSRVLRSLIGGKVHPKDASLGGEADLFLGASFIINSEKFAIPAGYIPYECINSDVRSNALFLEALSQSRDFGLIASTGFTLPLPFLRQRTGVVTSPNVAIEQFRLSGKHAESIQLFAQGMYHRFKKRILSTTQAEFDDKLRAARARTGNKDAYSTALLSNLGIEVPDPRILSLGFTGFRIPVAGPMAGHIVPNGFLSLTPNSFLTQDGIVPALVIYEPLLGPIRWPMWRGLRNCPLLFAGFIFNSTKIVSSSAGVFVQNEETISEMLSLSEKLGGIDISNAEAEVKKAAKEQKISPTELKGGARPAGVTDSNWRLFKYAKHMRSLPMFSVHETIVMPFVVPPPNIPGAEALRFADEDVHIFGTRGVGGFHDQVALNKKRKEEVRKAQKTSINTIGSSKSTDDIGNRFSSVIESAWTKRLGPSAESAFRTQTPLNVQLIQRPLGRSMLLAYTTESLLARINCCMLGITEREDKAVRISNYARFYSQATTGKEVDKSSNSAAEHVEELFPMELVWNYSLGIVPLLRVFSSPEAKRLSSPDAVKRILETDFEKVSVTIADAYSAVTSPSGISSSPSAASSSSSVAAASSSSSSSSSSAASASTTVGASLRSHDSLLRALFSKEGLSTFDAHTAVAAAVFSERVDRRAAKQNAEADAKRDREYNRAQRGEHHGHSLIDPRTWKIPPGAIWKDGEPPSGIFAHKKRSSSTPPESAAITSTSAVNEEEEDEDELGAISSDSEAEIKETDHSSANSDENADDDEEEKGEEVEEEAVGLTASQIDGTSRSDPSLLSTFATTIPLKDEGDGEERGGEQKGGGGGVVPRRRKSSSTVEIHSRLLHGIVPTSSAPLSHSLFTNSGRPKRFSTLKKVSYRDKSLADYGLSPSHGIDSGAEDDDEEEDEEAELEQSDAKGISNTSTSNRKGVKRSEPSFSDSSSGNDSALEATDDDDDDNKSKSKSIQRGGRGGSSGGKPRALSSSSVKPQSSSKGSAVIASKRTRPQKSSATSSSSSSSLLLSSSVSAAAGGGQMDALIREEHAKPYGCADESCEQFGINFLGATEAIKNANGRTHVESVHQSYVEDLKARGKYVCPFCCKVYDVERSYYMHLPSHDSSKWKMCEFCSYTHEQPGHVDKHILICPHNPHKVINAGRKKCQQPGCEEYRSNMTLHLASAHRIGKFFQCPFCDLPETFRKAHLVSHIWRMHKDEPLITSEQAVKDIVMIDTFPFIVRK